MSTPCQEDPELWFSFDFDEMRAAQWRCMECPLLLSCRAEATERDERAGVWGAVDFNQKAGGPRNLIEPKICTGCSRWMLNRNREGAAKFARRQYCTQGCATSATTEARWSSRRAAA